MIVDPACVKFVNGKFILSTNDKSNPIQIVRQIEKGNDNDVIIHLSDGTRFEDRICNLDVSIYDPSIINQTYKDFFAQDLDDTTVSVSFKTTTIGTIFKRFAIDEEFDMMPLFSLAMTEEKNNS